MTKHLSFNDIFDYLQAPGDLKFKKLRAHLLDCTSCRQKSVNVSQLLSELPDIVPYISEQAPELSNEIIQLINTSNNGKVKQRLLKILSEDPGLTKSALYYALNNSATRQSNEVVTTVSYAKSGILHWIKSRLSHNAPIWVNIPTAVTAALVATLLVNLVFTDQSEIIVASYQDEPVLVYKSDQPSPPGIGFFSSAREEKASFEGIHITTINNKKLRFSWPKIVGAEQYQIEILQPSDGSENILLKKSTKQQFMDVEIPELRIKQRYMWKFSGKVSDGRLFEAKGGFIVN